MQEWDRINRQYQTTRDSSQQIDIISPQPSNNNNNNNSIIRLDRIRIIRTRPRRTPSTRLITIHHANNTPIRPRNHTKRPNHHHKHTPANHRNPPRTLLHLALFPVIVQPHAPHRLEGHERAQQRADQGHQAVEDGDRAGDDVGD